jgi:transposase
VLEARLFPDAGTKQGHRRQVEPDWASIHRELKRKHVTLSILWDEYIVRDPEGYRYSRFCELYRIWAGKLSVTMRQTHVGGDKLFVDYAGDTVPVIIDRLTGAHTRALAAIGGVPRLIVPDMPRSPSSRPVCTSRRSTERTLRWRRITAPPCCRPGRDGRVTKPRSKLAC